MAVPFSFVEGIAGAMKQSISDNAGTTLPTGNMMLYTKVRELKP